MNFLRYPSSDQRLLCSDEALSPERVGPLDELSTIARAAKEEKQHRWRSVVHPGALSSPGSFLMCPWSWTQKEKKKHKICGQQKKKRQRCCCGTVAMVRIAGHSQRAWSANLWACGVGAKELLLLASVPFSSFSEAPSSGCFDPFCVPSGSYAESIWVLWAALKTV